MLSDTMAHIEQDVNQCLMCMNLKSFDRNRNMASDDNKYRHVCDSPMAETERMCNF